ncbi:MAG TPA: ATP-binding protein [Dehalococcoidia bacterium]|nr:ATP-binding protein [Dehalococcoidia bacterium]
MAPLSEGASIEPSAVVRGPADVEHVRRLVRSYCRANELRPHQSEELVLAASELANNLVRHATPGGTITCRRLSDGRHKAIEVKSTDSGPGIEDVDLAMTDGFSTVGGLGLGLAAARRAVDRFEISSEHQATVVRLIKWLD